MELTLFRHGFSKAARAVSAAFLSSFSNAIGLPKETR